MWLGHRDFETFDRSKGEEYVAYGESPFTGCVAATGPVDDPQSAADARHVVLHDPAYELADITAKRRILERAEFVNGHGPAVDHTRAMDMTAGASGALHDVLKFLALPFADHPGYREEWKPA